MDYECLAVVNRYGYKLDKAEGSVISPLISKPPIHYKHYQYI